MSLNNRLNGLSVHSVIEITAAFRFSDVVRPNAENGLLFNILLFSFKLASLASLQVIYSFEFQEQGK